MRKVELKMNEVNKYETIKKLVELNGNKKRAAKKIGCTLRHVNRLIKGYEQSGKAFFSHKSKGRKSLHAISEDIKRDIVDLYFNKYYDANFQHYTELLAEYEKLDLSRTTIASVLREEYIISPIATKKTKKRIKQELKKKQEHPNLSNQERNKYIERILSIEDIHPRRPRCAYFGEMIQMDASIYKWFGNSKTHLHISVDDSTGVIVGGYFDMQETLKGYYNVFHQILTNYGIPYKFLTDRRTIFEYKQKKSPKTEEDSFTQFSYACNQLGVEIQTSSVAQAKARVERIFQTLQSRLPIELRLAGITTLEHANEFLNSYIKKFNARFALSINHNKSVFEKQPTLDKINLTLSILADRKVDAGHSIRFEKKYFKPINKNSVPVYYHKGTKALVIKAFSGDLYVTINDKVYGLEEIPKHAVTSKNFDIVKTITKPKIKYIPPMSHPWKRDSFERYLQKQAHRNNKTA